MPARDRPLGYRRGARGYQLGEPPGPSFRQVSQIVVRVESGRRYEI
jgi:hypothetical protein